MTAEPNDVAVFACRPMQPLKFRAGQYVSIETRYQPRLWRTYSMANAPRADGTWVGLDGYYAGETLRIAPDHLDLATFVLTRTPYDPEAPVPGGVDERGWTAP